MEEKERDKLLGIKTVGIREWVNNNHYNRYEATPYKALDVLFENYKFIDINRVVDFGCGRGRVSFYLHNRFNLPVIGIEANNKTYEEALENKISYGLKTKHTTAPVEFKCSLAQHYKIDKKDNCFYFFNPFSVHIFRKVVDNILHSAEKDCRKLDLILYYPTREYEEFLENSTPFKIVDEIRIPGEIDKREKFIIYRLREEFLYKDI
ncbi:MAG TPA: SAM-dependent methyltransferase [Defluviitaleaceae bacterium]|mgnify:CR=1 FL=1|jgi:SAM-dependent methyltransferase|nr:SAM-dependent methyltransferase [Candidatus Epulonipiscium sp.]HOA81395.1 SAM-dependent methyltransferase [Defluviitaleaceae bacterium]